MMKTKKHTLLWFSGGFFLSLLVFVVICTGLSGKVLVVDPDGIRETTSAVVDSIRSGDWQTLQLLVSESPTLTPETGDDGSVEQQIWNAYRQSLQWVCEESNDVQGAHVTQRITVTCLDISGVTEQMAQMLLESSENTENRDASLLAAVEAVLASDAPMMQRQLTLTLVRKNRQWQVLADHGLLSLVSGFTAH